jgi:hypothetical protein
MRVRIAGLALLAALAVGVGADFSAPERAAAGDSRNCGVISKGSSDWRVRTTGGVKCKRGKKGVRRYLREGTPLPGYFCSRNGPLIYCGKGDHQSYSGQKL